MRFFAAIALLLASAFPASAQTPNWTGCYVGVHGSYSATDTATGLNTPLAPIGISFDGLSASGAGFGANAGCDYRFVGSPIVIGAFADYTMQDLDHGITVTLGGPLTARYSIGDSYTVGGRIGVLLTPTTLAYGLVGRSWAETDPLDVAGLVSFKTGDLTGWTVGGGIETQLAHDFTLKLEYRHTRYDSDRIGLVPGLLNLDLETVEHVGRVGISYRFTGW